jgi:hypothetical protein
VDFGKVAVVLLRMFYVDVVKPYGTPGGQQHDIQSRRRGEDVLKQMKSGSRLESWAAWRGFHALNEGDLDHGAWRCR